MWSQAGNPWNNYITSPSWLSLSCFHAWLPLTTCTNVSESDRKPFTQMKAWQGEGLLTHYNIIPKGFDLFGLFYQSINLSGKRLKKRLQTADGSTSMFFKVAAPGLGASPRSFLSKSQGRSFFAVSRRCDIFQNNSPNESQTQALLLSYKQKIHRSKEAAVTESYEQRLPVRPAPPGMNEWIQSWRSDPAWGKARHPHGKHWQLNNHVFISMVVECLNRPL